VADPGAQTFHQRLPESQQSVTNDSAGRTDRIRGQVARDRAASALAAARGVKLPIAP